MMQSEYLEWAKTRSRARFNLATSGLVNLPLSELGVTVDDIELSGPSWYGYEPLQEALARKCDVSTDCLVAATGTSMANYLAMAAVLNRGDEVLIEHPAYEPLVAVARYLGVQVKRFSRRFEDGFGIDPDEVAGNVTKQTRLIIITNLHNPSGSLTHNSALRALGEIALKTGARVLVDEVYLEMLSVEAPGEAVRADSAARSAFHLGSQFIVTSSLTKAYGLSGLRCGWILAEPELARRMWRLNDLFGSIPAHSAERLSVCALHRLGSIAERAAAVLKANRPLLLDFLDSREDLEAMRPEFGTVVFPRLKSGDVEKLCTLLRDKYETTIVPGNFFEMPDHFRLGIGCNSEILREGLSRLSEALAEV